MNHFILFVQLLNTNTAWTLKDNTPLTPFDPGEISRYQIVSACKHLF